MQKIERIEERLVYSDPQNPWVKLYFDKIRFPDGKEGYYNRIVEKDGIPSVAILPVDKMSVGIVKIYRYPTREWSLEIPRGFGEKGDLAQNAIRELHEETGILLNDKDLHHLGEIAPNSGILDSKVNIFWADCAGYKSDNGETQFEIANFKWYLADTVYTKIKTGAICDAFTISALMLANLQGVLA